MDVTEEDVERVHETKELVDDIIEFSDEREETRFDIESLLILREQLDMLHQALSVIVAQKNALGDDDGD